MAITTRDQLIAAARQQVTIVKTASVTAVAAQLTAIHQAAGNPGAGVLAVGNTAAGLVPTDLTAGFPAINAFGASAKGYLAGLDWANSVAANLILYDRLFHCGAYAFNANTTLAAQPSFSGRVPGGTDFTGLEIWIEQVTVGTGVQSVNVGYRNQAGADVTTGVIAAPAAAAVARMWPMPLAAGDSGVQRINSVVGSVATVGTFNVVVMRRLATMRVPLANYGDKGGWDWTGLVELFADSALCLACQPDSTATGLPYVRALIVNG